MIPFDVITNLDHRPEAIIGFGELRGHQFDALYALLPDTALSQPELARRWSAVFVLATAAWADEQLKRVPMLKPKGFRLGIPIDNPVRFTR